MKFTPGDVVRLEAKGTAEEYRNAVGTIVGQWKGSLTMASVQFDQNLSMCPLPVAENRLTLMEKSLEAQLADALAPLFQ